jgi:hypothetical protein
MNPLLSATLLIFTAVALVSCGVGPDAGRTLVSISVSPSAATVQNPDLAVQFVATGTFSTPPINVTPLPVLWKGNWGVLPDFCIAGQGCAGINSTTGLALCGGIPPKAIITASAPSDPNLPLNTPNVPMVSGTATLSCP